MIVFAYEYIDPLLDKARYGQSPGKSTHKESFVDWGEPLDKVYRDLGDTRSARANQRTSLDQLLQDLDVHYQNTPQDGVRVIVQHLRDLGDSMAEVSDRLHQLEQYNIDLVILENEEETNLAQSVLAQPVPNSPTPNSPSPNPPTPQLPNSSTLQLSNSPTTTSQQLQTFHRLQIEQRQRALQRGHAKSRLKLKPPPGKAPYGYRRGKDRYILDRSTAPVVKDFFDNFLLYGSLRRSVRYLARKYNKKISVSTGKRWLTNPVYRGHLAYKTGDVITHTHTPVLTEDEAAQVDRLLRRNSQLPRRSASAERSLAGLVQCAQCQSSMTITRVTQRRPKKGKKSEYLYLRPTHCTRTCSASMSDSTSASKPEGVPDGSTTGSTTGATKKPKACPGLHYDRVLDQTIDQICDTLPKITATAPLPDVAGFKQRIDAQIQSKQQVIEQLPALGESGVLDQDTIDLRTYNLRTEIAELQASLAQLPPVNFKETVQAVSLRQFWLDLSESERRFYFREFIHHIEIVRSPSDDSQWQTKLVLLLEMSR